MIEIPYDFSRKQKSIIKASLEDRVLKVSDEGVSYTPERFNKTCENLRTEGSKWLAKAANLAELFGEIDRAEGRFKEQQVEYSAKQYVLASLDYLVDPFDVIPDFEVSGYADDVLVLNLAASTLKTLDPVSYQIVERGLK